MLRIITLHAFINAPCIEKKFPSPSGQRLSWEKLAYSGQWRSDNVIPRPISLVERQKPRRLHNLKPTCDIRLYYRFISRFHQREEGSSL